MKTLQLHIVSLQKPSDKTGLYIIPPQLFNIYDKDIKKKKKVLDGLVVFFKYQENINNCCFAYDSALLVTNKEFMNAIEIISLKYADTF